MFNGSNVEVMPNYVPVEYPKWVGGVLIQNAEEERAHRAALTEAAEVARAAELTRPPSPAATRMQRTRDRRRAGRMLIRCDISKGQIEALAMAGFIDLARWIVSTDRATAQCSDWKLARRLCRLGADASADEGQTG
jgi:hypothetical protein